MTNDTRPVDGPIALYGNPPDELVDLSAEVSQFSPLLPGSQAIEAAPDASFGRAVVLAPPGTVERRFVLAEALRLLRPGGELTALAPKDKGGSRLAAELKAFGCEPGSVSRRHFRILEAARPERLAGLEEAVAAGRAYRDGDTGLWTQAGIFSFDRLDPGSALLLEHLPSLAGRGADLGCGIGVLGRAILQSPDVERLASIDLDRRAVEAARRNIDDARSRVFWADLRQPFETLSGLDFVVSNPPFHDGGAEDKALGQTFIRRASEMLRKGGAAFFVANRHLPYEAVLEKTFARFATLADRNGYKIIEARR